MENEQKEYELICVLEPHLEAAALDVSKKALEKTINDLKGKIIHFGEAEKRDLAYPINKEKQGIYLAVHIELEPEKIADLSKELKTNKQILRHLISVMEVMAGSEPKKQIARKPIIKKNHKTKESLPLNPPTGRHGTAVDKDEKMKLEEIDKKLDELVGL